MDHPGSAHWGLWRLLRAPLEAAAPAPVLAVGALHAAQRGAVACVYTPRAVQGVPQLRCSHACEVQHVWVEQASCLTRRHQAKASEAGGHGDAPNWQAEARGLGEQG